MSINENFFEFERLHETSNLGQIAKIIGIGEKRLRRIITYVGYEFDVSAKKWCYASSAGSKDKRNQSIQSVIEEMREIAPVVTNETNKVTSSNTKGNTKDSISTYFSPEEVEALQIIAREYIKRNKEGELGVLEDDKVILSNADIIEEIRKVVPRDSVTLRKTFALLGDVIEQLDIFCEKKRIRKSDFLAVAILDAINKYK